MTSQIFSNIYLNEFDRFVRHVLKPLAYVRYGDDVVLFASTRQQARMFERQATAFLQDGLCLSINPRNIVIVAASRGLHFLGHAITDEYAVVDRYTTRSVLTKVNGHSIASYTSLMLAKWPRRQLDWLLLDEIDQILDG